MPAPQPPKNKREMNWGRFSKTFAFWILVLLLPVAFFQLSGTRSEQQPKIKYTRYRLELTRDNIESVVIQGGKYVQGQFRGQTNIDGRNVKRFQVNLPAENSEKEIDALSRLKSGS